MSWRTDPRHRLMFGAVDFTDPTSGLCVLSDSSNSWGSPQPVTSIVDSLLMDGSLVKWEHDDNRTVTFLVAAMATDSIALAQAEARLVAELSKRNALSWTPPDGLGPTTVFQVLTSSAEMVPAPGTVFDESEMNLIRCYAVTLTCAPHTFSSTSTTVTSVTQSPGSPVVIADGSTATGWSTGVTASGGFLTLPIQSTTFEPSAPGSSYGKHTWSGRSTLTFSAQDFSTTPFLYFDFPPGSYVGVRTVSVNGGLPIHWSTQFVSPDNSALYRNVFPVSASSVTTLTFSYFGTWTGKASDLPGIPIAVKIKGLTRAPNLPGITMRETLMSFPVGGSVRTPGSLNLSSAASTVGDALIYTAPDLGNGYVPSLRRYRTSGGTTTSDATAWSGFSEPITLASFSIPVSTLAEGGYALVARLKSLTLAAGTTKTWTAQLANKAGTLVGPVLTETIAGPITVGPTWTLVPLGTIMLPPTVVPDESAATVVINLTLTATYDDLYLLRRDDDTALTIVQGAKKNLWIDSPTIEQPAPRIYTGTAADRSDAYGAASTALSWEQHIYHPSSTYAYIICNATDAAASLTYTKAWHTNAAEPGDG